VVATWEYELLQRQAGEHNPHSEHAIDVFRLIARLPVPG